MGLFYTNYRFVGKIILVETTTHIKPSPNCKLPGDVDVVPNETSVKYYVVHEHERHNRITKSIQYKRDNYNEMTKEQYQSLIDKVKNAKIININLKSHGDKTD